VKKNLKLQMEYFPLILQPPEKLSLQAVKWFSQTRIAFTAYQSSFTRPVKTTGSP
jgi:hypothetical protein